MDDLEKTSTLPPEFQQAAGPVIEPPKVMVSLPLDADLVAFFQGEGEPSDMTRHINGVLRFYMETSQIQEADAELAVHMGERIPAPAP